MKDCIVIGGGIIGLCTAYYLHKEGHSVKIIDQSNMDAGASYVNAGYLSPSHIIPLASPGVIKKGLKWMFNVKSPLYIKPRLETDFLKWIWAFNRSASAKNVKKAVPVIKDISIFTQELFDELKNSENFSFHYQKKGLFMLCKTDKALESELGVAALAREQGLDAKGLSPDQIKKLEPEVKIDVKGAVYYQCDSHTTPHEFMDELKAYLNKVGVQFFKNEKVIDLDFSSNKITALITDKDRYKADEFILTAGSWSPILAKKIGLNLLIQAGKGYRINTKAPTGITIPAIFSEAKAAVTPMNGFTRFAGTMELAGINHQINKTRVMAIAEAVTKYYPEVILTADELENAACGLRPVSPDGLPYIGRSYKCHNLTLATGHAMMGWSMSTATGKLVAEIISNLKPSLNLDNFNPDRSF